MIIIYTLKQHETGTRSQPTARRPDIDMLNICMTWLILLFHVACIYNHGHWYVKDPDILHNSGPENFSFYATLFTSFMNAWNMPLFFFMSGVSSWLSLNRYTSSYSLYVSNRETYIIIKLVKCNRVK